MERVNKEACHLNHNKQNNRFKTGCLSRVEGAQDGISRGNTGVGNACQLTGIHGSAARDQRQTGSPDRTKYITIQRRQ